MTLSLSDKLLVERRLKNIETAATKSGYDVRRLREAAERFVSDTHRTAEATTATARQMAVLLAIHSEYLPAMLDELSRTTSTLYRIADMLATPRATAALELRNLAADLAARHLLAEAEREIRRSLDVNGYDPTAHLVMGRILTDAGRDTEAATAFQLMRRYSSDPRAQAAAALFEAASWNRARQASRARATLLDACSAMPTCAELWYAFAEYAGSAELARAFSISPDLVLDAMVERTADVEDASSRTLLAGQLEFARQLSAALHQAIIAVDGRGGTKVDRLPPEPSDAERSSKKLLWTLIVVTEAQPLVNDLSATLRRKTSAIVRRSAPRKPRARDFYRRGGVWTLMGLAISAIVGLAIGHSHSHHPRRWPIFFTAITVGIVIPFLGMSVLFVLARFLFAIAAGSHSLHLRHVEKIARPLEDAERKVAEVNRILGTRESDRLIPLLM